MDAKYVFSELDVESKNKLNVFHPEKQKKAKAEGYPENDYTLHHKLSVTDFITSESGIESLQNASEIVIDDERIASHPKTTKEIVECCKDIKVLGRKELRSLLAWWKLLKEEFCKPEEEEKPEEQEDESTVQALPITLEDEEDKEDAAIEEEIAGLKAEEMRDAKRKRKKANKERQKLNERLNLKMVHKGDEGPMLEGDDMFNLKEIKTHQHLNTVVDQTPDVVAESEPDSDDEDILPKKLKYEKDAGHLDSSGLYYKSEDSEVEDSDADDSDSDKSGLGNEFCFL